MAKSDFVPPRDAEFLLWHDRLTTAVAGNAATFSLPPADVTGLADDNTTLHAKATAAAAAEAAAQQATREKTATRRTAEQRARALARRIKAHPAYTPARGAQLGIEGPEDATDLATSKPEFWATAQPRGAVELGFTKSKSDGVNIYSQREGEPGFVFLGRDTASPYVDNRPLLVAGKPEVRKYKAVYVLADQETGQFSDEVAVTCQP
jgi:hypothetical protein